MLDLRRSLMALPVAERREALAKQAEEMKLHYSETREERTRWQGGEIYDYDSTEKAPRSEDSGGPQS